MGPFGGVFEPLGGRALTKGTVGGKLAPFTYLLM
jgi:hypothetical protein